MQALRVFSVVPKLPPRLEPLWDIAYNLWFSCTATCAGAYFFPSR